MEIKMLLKKALSCILELLMVKSAKVPNSAIINGSWKNKNLNKTKLKYNSRKRYKLIKQKHLPNKILKNKLLFKQLHKFQRKKNWLIKINQNQLKAKTKKKSYKNLKNKTKKKKKSQKLN